MIYPNRTVRTIINTSYVNWTVISNMLGLKNIWFLSLTYFLTLTYLAVGGDVDFRSTTQYAKIISGSNRSTVNIVVINDTIVEGDETFTLQLNVPSSYGPSIKAGSLTRATATIIDTSSRFNLANRVIHLLYLMNILCRDQGKVYTQSVWWIRSCRVCTCKPWIGWRNIC